MNWLRSMMSSPSGDVSSKRGALALFVLVFLFCVIYNQQTGKNMDTDFKNMLFKLVALCMLLVFGDRAIKAWETIKGSVNVDKTESSVTKTEVTTKTIEPEKPTT